MRIARGLFWAGLSVCLAGVHQVAAEEAQAAAEPAAQDQAQSEQAVDEDWLNTVWTQVDDMVKEEEFKLQETVTVAGVRGAEAEDNILDKLYYKGGKRYPSQDKLTKAIETLKKAIEGNPRGEGVPRQRYFIAQCYEKLGQPAKAREYYAQVTREHPQSPWAPKAQERLTQLASAAQ